MIRIVYSFTYISYCSLLWYFFSVFEDPQLKTIKYDNERDGITGANQHIYSSKYIIVILPSSKCTFIITYISYCLFLWCLFLVFDDNKLKEIKYDNDRDGITEANQQMLRQWSEKHAERASRKWLATACLSLNRRDLIEVLAS